MCLSSTSFAYMQLIACSTHIRISWCISNVPLYPIDILSEHEAKKKAHRKVVNSCRVVRSKPPTSTEMYSEGSRGVTICECLP